MTKPYPPPRTIDATTAINIALDDLMPPFSDDFLRDWRAGKNMTYWKEVIEEQRAFTKA